MENGKFAVYGRKQLNKHITHACEFISSPNQSH